jgi:hypothetical protein
MNISLDFEESMIARSGVFMKKGLLALLLAAWTASAMAASTGTLIRTEQARVTPSTSAASVAQLTSGTQVEIVGRKGGWLQVKAQGKTGWVRLLSVRSSKGGSAGSAADIGGVVGLATRRNNNQVVAVAGLRGLNEEDLKGAHYDAAQIKKLDSYTVSRQQAESFAARAGLQSRHVAYLKAPVQQSAPSTEGWDRSLQ